MKFNLISFLTLFAIALTSCSPDTEQTSYQLDNVVFEFEGPLFEGPNMGQHTVKVNLADKIKDLPEGASVHKASLSKAVITPEIGTDFGLISSLVLQLASDDTEMVQAGVLNPLPAGSTQADLQPSTEAELADFFNGESFILVLDAGLKEDLYDNIQLKGTFEFNLEIKK